MDEPLSVISRLVAQNESQEGAFQAIVSYLRQTFSKYSWVGIYLVVGNKLVLSAWDGDKATQHTEIELGKGICGLAARTKETVIVDDVNSHPEYLACFPETRSEIVVPLMRGDTCIGEIDIDSNTPSAFTREDKAFLEGIASLLVDAYF